MSLHRLARRLGIATSYTSAWGAQVQVPDTTVVAIIAAFGFDTTGADWIAQVEATLDRRETARLVEPVLVAWDGVLRSSSAFARAHGHELLVRGEDGGDVTAAVRAGGPLPLGYYDVLIDGAATALIISAPRRVAAPTDRKLCVFAPLYALRPADTTRYADLRELDELVAWVAAHGGDGVLTLPLLAGFFDDPAEPSPYAPVSRIMWNELYAVVDRPPVAADGPLVDYTAAYAATRHGIEQAVHALDHDPFHASAFLQFLAAHPDVGDYARFRAAGEQYGRDWRTWPVPLRDGAIGTADVDTTRVRYHCVAQWLAHTQLAEVAGRAHALGITLGLDLAVGTHPHSFDVWSRQASYAFGLSVGAPPDAYFPGGQVWGFPPPIPARERDDGYRQLRAALRHHLAVASLLRIDHVMGLLRLFWIPAGASPAEGTYVHAALDEQLAVVCLEAHRAGATIVGENLGLVPAEIDDALRTHGLLGMTVVYDTLDHRTRAARPLTAPAHDLATFGTHDMATFAGFVHGDDLTDRLALGFGDPRAARAHARRRSRALEAAAAARGIDTTPPALLRAAALELATSPAPWMVLSLEDLWGERAPQNVPGTTTERPNWLRRAAHPLADAPPEAGALLRQVSTARRDGVRPSDAPH